MQCIVYVVAPLIYPPRTGPIVPILTRGLVFGDKLNVLKYKDPPFTIFVIYGAADISVALKNGGWGVWENASKDFIENQISEKIEKAKEIYPNDFNVRGYRLIECYSQVSYCIVLESTKSR